jgi:hypothetical protein
LSILGEKIMSKNVREVQTPYVINATDEAIGRDTIIIRRENRPVAVVVPYDEYQALTHQVSIPTSSSDPEFEIQWQAFQGLKPELLEKYEGKWVAIVNEQVAVVDKSFDAVSRKVVAEFGNVAHCISQVTRKPRVAHMTTRRVITS